MRPDKRALTALRPIEFIPDFTRWAEGSVLTRFGETHVLCNVSIEERLPRWLMNQGSPHGWLTAEYAMLPRSTHSRVGREQRWPRGRTQEISRLIGRSLRLGLDLKQLGNRQLIVDCDVLQADGGTRTAAITGAWLAVALALRPLISAKKVPAAVMARQIGAISVGIVSDEIRLDLAYEEDAAAAVDLNVVMTAAGGLVEVQGTAESEPFSRDQMTQMLDLAAKGITELAAAQQAVLASASAPL